jgi:hypothetical protein
MNTIFGRVVEAAQTPGPKAANAMKKPPATIVLNATYFQ